MALGLGNLKPWYLKGRRTAPGEAWEGGVMWGKEM